MIRNVAILASLGIVFVSAFCLITDAESQSAGSFVALQAASPGTSQNGHTNINGTARASQFVGGGSGLTGVNANLLDGLDSTAFLQAVPSPLILSGSNPGDAIISGINSSSSIGSYGVYGETTSTSGSIPSGVIGRTASDTGRGVAGLASSPTGGTYGVFGASSSSTGIGVFGYATNQFSGSGDGVVGRTLSPGGRGVFGDAVSVNGVDTYGVHGKSAGATGGRGVFGEATSTSGTTYGVYGSSVSTSGRGVFGAVTADTGINYGLRAESSSADGRGVYGLGSASSATDEPYGVRGQASTATTGYGVYAVGDLGASGTKSFRIDHPLDPENKYLLHYCSESPFPQNFYNGNVTTDANGYAWVELQDYFEAINANFKYQLTVLDNSDDFVLAKVTKEIESNQFQIRTSKPQVKVSWMVFADRNDKRVQFNRPSDVREKRELNKGRYEHPEYYGLPQDAGLDFHPKLEKRRQSR